MDKLNAISVFCKVIETQSFTQAANQQNISVAMASKLVSQLEEHLKRDYYNVQHEKSCQLKQVCFITNVAKQFY